MLTATEKEDGRSRVIIDRVRPEVDGGRFPIKRTVGEQVVVTADVFADGHDVLRCLLRHRPEGADTWIEVPMEASYNDLWQASFKVSELGRHVYTVVAWVDRFFTWQHDLARRSDAKDIVVAMQVGAQLVLEAAASAPGAAGARLKEFAEMLGKTTSPEAGKQLGADRELTGLMTRHGGQRFATSYERTLAVVVEPVRARFSTWYEMFPRSCVPATGRHGTFAECEKRLPYIAEMGFDVLYLPPIGWIGGR